MVNLDQFRDPKRDKALRTAAQGDFSKLEALNDANRAQTQEYLEDLRGLAEAGATRYTDPRMGQEILRAATHAEELVRRPSSPER